MNMNPSQPWQPRSEPLVPAQPAVAYHPLIERYDLEHDPHEHDNLVDDAAHRRARRQNRVWARKRRHLHGTALPPPARGAPKGGVAMRALERGFHCGPESPDGPDRCCATGWRRARRIDPWLPPTYTGAGEGWPVGVTEQAPSAAPPRPRQRMGLDAYFARREDDGPLTEWVAGELVTPLPPTTRHQDLVWFLGSLLRLFVSTSGSGRILGAPFAVLLSPQGPVREPDLLFVAAEHAARITARRLEGAPDLVVECVSQDSVGRDRAEKFDEYEQAGVREYWLIDSRPGRDRADFWLLEDDGRYRAMPPDAAGVYRSSVLPGFWLRTAWLRADPLPHEAACWREIDTAPHG